MFRLNAQALSVSEQSQAGTDEAINLLIGTLGSATATSCSGGTAAENK